MLGVLTTSLVLLARVAATAAVVLSERAERWPTTVVRWIFTVLRLHRDPAVSLGGLAAVRVCRHTVSGGSGPGLAGLIVAVVPNAGLVVQPAAADERPGAGADLDDLAGAHGGHSGLVVEVRASVAVDRQVAD